MNEHMRARVAEQKGSRAAADPSRLLPGLGYAVLGPIAAGNFSTILRCRDVASGQLVAVKSFDTFKCAGDADVGAARDAELGVLRLLREAAASTSAADGGGHPHIANMLAELGDAEAPHQHAVLQYSAGGTLKKCLSELKTDALNSRAMAVALARAAASGGEVADKGLPGMEFPMAAVAMRQLASALAHLHGLDVCHRDVKPANILLSSVGTTGRGESGRAAGGGRSLTADSLHLRLTGCATLASRACAGTRRLTQFNATPLYAAAEIASPADATRGYLGRPVDMWALGCVVYPPLADNVPRGRHVRTTCVPGYGGIQGYSEI